MGSVWLAKNEVTDREFAIKVLLPRGQAAAALSRARPLRCARRACAARSRHPSILEIYDAGAAPELDGAPYLVMERLDGAPLDVVLRLSGASLAPRLALDIVVQISRGPRAARMRKGSSTATSGRRTSSSTGRAREQSSPRCSTSGSARSSAGSRPEIRRSRTRRPILGSPIPLHEPRADGPRAPMLDARSDVHRPRRLALGAARPGRALFPSTSCTTSSSSRSCRGRARSCATRCPASVSKVFARDDRRAGVRDRSRRALRRPRRSSPTRSTRSSTELGGGMLVGANLAAGRGPREHRSSSNAPPPMHGSTDDATCRWISLGLAGLLVRPVGRERWASRSSATSFAETEFAVASAPRRRAARRSDLDHARSPSNT